MVLGVSSTRYTMKSSPKDFVVLYLLLFRGASLSSPIGFSTSEGSSCVTGMVGSGEIGSLLDTLGVSFIGNTSSKNVISLDSIIVPSYMSGTLDFTIKNLYPTL